MAAVSVIYDLLCPSPQPLKETASMAVALEIWRTEIREHRKNNTLSEMRLDVDLSSMYQLRNTPSRIVHNVESYLKKIGPSIKTWMKALLARMDDFNQTDILACFDDFVCDFDGTIDSVRTGRRAVHCDGISLMVRFKIACVYCLEEDMLRMWPDVPLNERTKRREKYHVELFYWICRLRNQMYKLNYDYDDPDYSYFFIFYVHGFNWSSFKYFFDRLDSETRMNVLTTVHCWDIICRHLLVAFSDEEIEKLLDKSGSDMIFWLLSKGECYVLPFWTRVKGKIKVHVFKQIVKSMLTKEFRGDEYSYDRNKDSMEVIWKTAPDLLKKATVPNVLTDDLLRKIPFCGRNDNRFSLLKVMLSDTSIEDRKIFWNNQWRKFITKVNTNDADYLTKLCLNDDCEINEFKKRILPSQHQVALWRCFQLLKETNFQELYAFSKYWGFSKETMQGIRSELLINGIPRDTIYQVSSLDEFINYSYNGDTILANEFKAQLLLSPETWTQLTVCLNDGPYNQYHSFWLVMNLVETFAPSQQIVTNVKKTRIVPLVEDFIRQNAFFVYFSYHLPIFLKWCFETEEALANFKKNLDPHRIIQGMIWKALDYKMEHDFTGKIDDCSLLGCNARMPHTCDYFLEDFLRWLMGSGEAVEELKRRYEDDEVFVSLINISKENVRLTIRKN